MPYIQKNTQKFIKITLYQHSIIIFWGLPDDLELAIFLSIQTFPLLKCRFKIVAGLD